MTVLLLTLGITAALMAGMAVGVVFGRKPLRGSCGGIGGAADVCACDEAGIPRQCEDGPDGRKGPPDQLVSAGGLGSHLK